MSLELAFSLFAVVFMLALNYYLFRTDSDKSD